VARHLFRVRFRLSACDAKMRALSIKGGESMRAARVFTVVLTAGLTMGGVLHAQTVPDITLPPGDAARGKAIFESSKSNCLSCHRVNGSGSLFGPDLSTIGSPPRGGGVAQDVAVADVVVKLQLRWPVQLRSNWRNRFWIPTRWFRCKTGMCG